MEEFYHLQNAPFKNLKGFFNEEKLSQEFINKWCIPYYFAIFNREPDEELLKIANVKNEISSDVILKLLGDKNWRTRSTGAYLAAVLNDKSYIEIIGTHLLRSEGTYAGGTYSFVLAHFNTPECSEYLDSYLMYYLTQYDLFFDQDAVMESVLYLDKINNTNKLEKYTEMWLNFIHGKPYWKATISIEKFEQRMAILKSLAK